MCECKYTLCTWRMYISYSFYVLYTCYILCLCGRDLFDTRTGQWESAAGGGAGDRGGVSGGGGGGGGGYNRMPVIDDW